MNLPTKEQFTHWYTTAPECNESTLIQRLELSSSHPEYSLLSSFLCRCLANGALQEGQVDSAVQWSERALAYLEDKRTLKKAWGSDEDYSASLHATLLLTIRSLSCTDEPTQWVKAKKLAQNILDTGFPSIYKKDNSREGVHIALMLMGVLNRLNEHEAAMAWGTKLQEAAQLHKDSSTEARAAFYWALASLLQAKVYHLNNRQQDYDALLQSSGHVFNALCSNLQTKNLLQPVLEVTLDYVNWRQTGAKNLCFVDKFSGDALWSLLDVVQQHGDQLDENLAGYIISKLDALDT